MTRSPRLLDRSAVAALLVAAVVALGACSTEATGVATTDATTTTAPERTTPSGVQLLENPGDGGTVTISVGDRIRLPEVDGPGGLVLGRHRDRDEVDALLVPVEGSDGQVYEAIAPGRVTVLDTVYDPSRSCVPPATVAEFTLEVTEDPGTVPDALRSAAAAPRVRSAVAAPTCVGD